MASEPDSTMQVDEVPLGVAPNDSIAHEFNTDAS